MYACAEPANATFPSRAEPVMDHVAMRLSGAHAWTHLGGKDDAKKPLEVIVRSFDRAVEFAAGDAADAPSADPVVVPVGEGRRLEGRHFFVRPKESGAPCRISYRGI